MSDSTKPVLTNPQASLPACLSTSDAYPGNDVSLMDTAVEAQIPRMVFSTSSSVEALRLLVHAALSDSGLEPLQVSGITSFPSQVFAHNEHCFQDIDGGQGDISYASTDGKQW